MRFVTYVFSLANARETDYLSRLTDVAEIRETVVKWASQISATEKELWRAVLYVRNAYRLDDEETIEKDEYDEDAMDALWMQVISCAGALGVVPKDLMTVTHSELVALLIQANIHARFPMKQSVAKDYILYKKVMRQIEDRGTKAKENKEARKDG